jgi:acylpyruvate hydrolase
MKLATTQWNGGTRGAIIESDSAQLLDIEDAGAVLTLMSKGIDPWSIARLEEVSLVGLRFAPPVIRPEKIFCIGLNYYAHAEEANLRIPATPLLFSKYTRAMLGATDDIVIPPETEKCDWEAELALVIGSPVRRVDEAGALDAIAGFTVLNDVTMRDWQKQNSQFLPGKTFESSTPFGPWIVSKDEVDDARDLRLTCHVNGVVMQDASTSGMIFSPAAAVSYLSHIITLMPGDIVALGTPSGVGSLREPPVFLKPGDRVVTECEGIGRLDNLCVADDGLVAQQYV